MELKGQRYADAQNAELQEIIRERLPYFDYKQTCNFYRDWIRHGSPRPKDSALLGCNDRFFLLAFLLNRKDVFNPWLFNRCREVEADEFDRLDLWARWHYKSTIITFAGSIQAILCDPEITIAIFGGTNPIARPFLKQIKDEFETNEELIESYPDVLWEKPRIEAPSWSVASGITVKRKSNPKECTIEAYGLIDAMPTGRHFRRLVYDDLITQEHVTNPEMIQKVTERWELSDNLGVGAGTQKVHLGTRYSFADPYGIMIERGVLKPRLYPATDNGRLDGRPVFMTKEHWEKVKKTQRSVVAAQMLQNPIAGKENMFKPEYFVSWDVRPRHLSVYIMVDPASSKRKTSDRTAMAVIGVDANFNKFLLDGYRHRMSLSERWQALKNLYLRWSKARGVTGVMVGYEKYGMQADLEYIEERQQAERVEFPIKEINWPNEGQKSKVARVERLEPDVRLRRFFLPALIFEPGTATNSFDGSHYWSIDLETSTLRKNKALGPTKAMKRMAESGMDYLNCSAIRRLDEDRKPYDVTSALMEEMLFFPFAPKDDLVDAASRIYDMDVQPPSVFEDELADQINDIAYPDA